ncbi:MAG: 30S ribosomal protein S20 [Rhodospirillaceae bacterium]|jgi:small subunit ribosomal protein S20|nr:30S ribosomal protein S20 [Rhodospirillaceae bacterium]MBT5374058.1 30S ribosomal protein S20 [Rhodospirillaceae bacterium]MBT5659186.1 30S ribosomal protein S20 [Rhodospirillaceae bacterium]MBT5751083.1 30S ribosomal protein S20 [Rhodospirillaceae bacterium]
MANIRSAKKRTRKSERQTLVNRTRRTHIRSLVKSVETAIEGGDKKIAEAAMKAAEPEMDRGVSRGIMHRNTVSRKISRLSARIKVLS